MRTDVLKLPAVDCVSKKTLKKYWPTTRSLLLGLQHK